MTLFDIGLLNQPKWGHLKDLHRAIKLSEPALLYGVPSVTPLGNFQEVGISFDFILWVLLVVKMNTVPFLYFLPYRLMFSNQHLEPVLLFLQTTTRIHLRRCLSGMRTTTYLLGLSVSFLIARIRFITPLG